MKVNMSFKFRTFGHCHFAKGKFQVLGTKSTRNLTQINQDSGGKDVRCTAYSFITSMQYSGKPFSVIIPASHQDLGLSSLRDGVIRTQTEGNVICFPVYFTEWGSYSHLDCTPRRLLFYKPHFL